MNRLETALKIALTNWIILVLSFVGYWIYFGIFAISEAINWNFSTFMDIVLGGIFIQIFYGIALYYIVCIMISILIDIILFMLSRNNKHMIIKLLISTASIYSLIIIYLYDKNDLALFNLVIVFCLVFPLAQALRYKRIQKILGLSEKIPKWHYLLLLSPSIISLLLWSYTTLKDITYVYPKPNIVTINGVMYQNHQFNQDMNWTQANQYCENLSFGGYQDWRLPTQEELYGMMVAYPDKNAISAEDDPKLIAWREKNQDKQTTNHRWHKYYIRQEFVGNIEDDYLALWSSKIEDGDAYYVDFTNAYPENREPLESPKKVSCVRK
jgi:hypothetical protein